jgi:hypothetical protein
VERMEHFPLISRSHCIHTLGNFGRNWVMARISAITESMHSVVSAMHFHHRKTTFTSRLILDHLIVQHGRLRTAHFDSDGGASITYDALVVKSVRTAAPHADVTRVNRQAPFPFLSCCCAFCALCRAHITHILRTCRATRAWWTLRKVV